MHRSALLVLLLAMPLLAQETPPTFTSLETLLEKRESHTGPVVFESEAYGYKVTVPTWANVQKTGDERIFGVLLPQVAGVRNAVAVKATPKDQFPSFEAFRKYVYEDNRPDQPFIMNNFMTFKGGKTLAPVTENRAVYQVLLESHEVTYHCKYVLMETPKAWLLVDFFATKDTYEKNLARFDQLAAGVEILPAQSP